MRGPKTPVWLWVWLWVCVHIPVEAQVTKYLWNYHGKCVPIDSFPAGSSFPSTSEVQCAALVGSRRAVGYIFGGASCTLLGEGKGLVSNANAFFGPPYTLEEVATNKQAYGSVIMYSYKPSLAVDVGEDDDSMYHSLLHTEYPWWLVDLGETRVIHEVQILTRRGCCPERLHDVEIRVGGVLRTDGDLSSYRLFSTYQGPYTLSEGRLSCRRGGGVQGRFLSIQKVKPRWTALQLVDVNVFAKKQ